MLALQLKKDERVVIDYFGHRVEIYKKSNGIINIHAPEQVVITREKIFNGVEDGLDYNANNGYQKNTLRSSERGSDFLQRQKERNAAVRNGLRGGGYGNSDQ